MNTRPFERIKGKHAGCQLTMIGCFYVVSIKKGNRLIASVPCESEQEAVDDFDFKYSLIDF